MNSSFSFCRFSGSVSSGLLTRLTRCTLAVAEGAAVARGAADARGAAVKNAFILNCPFGTFGLDVTDGERNDFIGEKMVLDTELWGGDI